MLLEREAPLDQIRHAHEEAMSAGGRLVLVMGEAGIGKTALIEAFIAGCARNCAVYRGGCEALFTPRPLGPLFDIAAQLGGELLAMLRSDTDNHRIYAHFLALITRPEFAGSVFVFEDIHWADAATMDLLKYIGRRITQSNCLILASYRDDEIGATHPLNHVIGDLPRPLTRRIHLAPLSVGGIAELGGCDQRRAREILRVTDGNPFFVHELLSSAGHGVPATVTDAILAKAARLSDDARLLLNLVSVAPGKCELSILEGAFSNALQLIDECAELGLLTIDGPYVAFRHELARLAVEDALPAGQRSRCNALMLAEIRARMPDALARLAHHADMAGDNDAVQQYAPAAARQAARLGAHREAVALYRQALQSAGALDERRRAELMADLAYEFYVTGKISDAIDTHRRCLELWKQCGDEVRQARSLRWLSRLHWFLGKRDAAEHYAEQALHASEALDDKREYAMACSNRAQLYMLDSDADQTVAWAGRAIELAECLGDIETLAHALNNLGTALGQRSPDEGRPHLERSLRLALENDFQEHVARAYTNLSSIAVATKRYDDARRYLDAGLEYTAERDLDSWLYYMQGWRARLRLETGDWDAAADDAMTVVHNSQGATLVVSPALTALAILRLRRGDPDFESVLEQAFACIAEAREVQRVGPLMAARAELAWLTGSAAADAAVIVDTRDWALRQHERWITGELCAWLRRLGIDDALPDDLPAPYDLLLRRGDWAGAAAAWQELGCPYEAALALAEGDEGARRTALDRFTALGAEPAADRLRRALRAAGVRNLPKRQRRSTRDNPGGLTNRQVAVLAALAEGLSDAEIATRLFISPRTVGHHVSAILGKLGVQSRTEAAVAARDLGVTARK